MITYDGQTKILNLDSQTIYLTNCKSGSDIEQLKHISNAVISPSFERVPEGVFVKNGCKLCYGFGNNQFLSWDTYCSCYSVVGKNDLCNMYPISPSLIPTTFGELKPGEWYRWFSDYLLKTGDGRSVQSFLAGAVVPYYSKPNLPVLRVSEVMP